MRMAGTSAETRRNIKQCNFICDSKWCIKRWFDGDRQIDIGIGTTDSAVASNSALDR
jgi:hypothetical protein